MVRLNQRFGPDGDGWRAAGYFDYLRSRPDGFWLVLYLTSSDTMVEEAPIRTALGKEFAAEEWAVPPHLKLFRCRPPAPAACPRQE